MPLPNSTDLKAWRDLLSVAKWSEYTDHELCEAFVRAYETQVHIEGRVRTGALTPQAAKDPLLVNIEVQGALHFEISIRMKKIIWWINSDSFFISDVVQKLMEALQNTRSPTSRSLRGEFEGATGSFTLVVKERALDEVRAITAIGKRDGRYARMYPPPDENSADEDVVDPFKYVDLDELRGFIQSPAALAVFDLLRAGLRQNEIAQTLGVNVRTVRARRDRAVADIRAHLVLGDQ